MRRARPVVADLNGDPPPSEPSICPSSSARNGHSMGDLTENGSEKDIVIADYREKQVVKLKKCHPGSRNGGLHENGHDGDVQPQLNGVTTARGGKITNLIYGLVHVARKMPKNAHAHFLLGLLYQRLGQIQKAVFAFEKSSEVSITCDEEIRRPDLLSLVQIHHAQYLLQGSTGDYTDETIELEELDAILLKVKKSVHSDVSQSAVWNMLGLILLWTGHIESAIAVFSTLLSVASDNLDAPANLGVAYLQTWKLLDFILLSNGSLELSEKCFQDLLLKDQNHPAALINYGWSFPVLSIWCSHTWCWDWC